MNIRGRIEVGSFPGADFRGAKFFEFENLEELNTAMREAGELVDEIDVRIEPSGALPDIIAFEAGVVTGQAIGDKGVKKIKNRTLWAGHPKAGYEIEACQEDSSLIGEEFNIDVSWIAETYEDEGDEAQ